MKHNQSLYLIGIMVVRQVIPWCNLKVFLDMTAFASKK